MFLYHLKKILFIYPLLVFFVFNTPIYSSNFSFEDYKIYKEDPVTYTLYLLDYSRFLPLVTTDPNESSGDESVNEQNTNDGEDQYYLKPSLLKDESVSFATTVPGQEIHKWIREEKANPDQPIIIRLMTRHSFSAARFLERITQTPPSNGQNLEDEADNKGHEEDFSFSGGMIIIPQTDPYSIAFTFGIGWQSLLNKDVVVPRWGLRIAVSENVGDPKKIREVYTKTFRNSVPSKRKELTSGYANIRSFGLEVSSEVLDKIRLRLAPQYKTNSVCKGADYLKLTFPKQDQDNSAATLASLKGLAEHFFTISVTNPLPIHKKLRGFIDEDVRDPKLLTELLARLIGHINNRDNKYDFFLHDDIWSLGLGKNILFGDNKSRAIYDHFKGIESLDDTIKLTAKKGPKSVNVRWRHILYSLPFAHHDNFYRYDRGMFLRVDQSRFEGIKKQLRSVKMSSTNLGLPSFCLDDKMGKKGDYAELRYNKRAVASLNATDGQEAFLIDRLMIPLKKGGGHIFEYGDIFLSKDSQYYIIHVKRAGAKSLSHHREQVERSAEYFGELDRTPQGGFFLKAAINDLFRDYDVLKSLEKARKVTGPFQKTLKTIKDQNTLQDLIDKIYNEKPDSPLKTLTFLLGKTIETQENNSLFNDYLPAVAHALDCLHECMAPLLSVEALDSKEGYKENEHYQKVSSFINRMHLALKGGDALFNKGVLKKNNQKNITFVLAVVDDREVQSVLDNKKKELAKDKKNMSKKDKQQALNSFRGTSESFVEYIRKDKKNPLFKSQDLWGLDRTRMLVEKKGFSFALLVTNEYTEENEWDAFGQFVETNDISDSSDDDETGIMSDDDRVIKAFKSEGLPRPQQKKRNDIKKIITYFKQSPGKKFPWKTIQGNIGKNLKGPLFKTLTDVGILTRETSGRPYQYSLAEDFSENIDKSKDSDNTSSNVIKKEASLSLTGLFDSVSLVSPHDVRTHVIEKLSFEGGINHDLGLYQNYITCPTVGDGDCFFHAVVTESGETKVDFCQRASEMRQRFCDLIQSSDDFARLMVPLVYEEYLLLSSGPNFHKVPTLIQELFQKNNLYIETRANIIQLGFDPLSSLKFSAKELYSLADIQNQISLVHIRNYMKRFRTVEGESTYISFRNDMVCPAELLALLNGKRVNFFTYNKVSKKLDLPKEASIFDDLPEYIQILFPNGISGIPIINILISGVHYVRLFNPQEGGAAEAECQQIIVNYEGHE